jgi:hypothetical protein
MTLTLEEVTERHHERIREELAERGLTWTRENLCAIPMKRWFELQEANRRDYLAMAGDVSEGAPRIRRADITDRLKDFFKRYAGFVASAREIAAECRVSDATVYSFMQQNPGSVKVVRRGLFEIHDVDADRAAFKAEKVAAPSLDKLLTALTGHS